MVFHEAFCFITWMPENVPAIIKARVSTHQVRSTSGMPKAEKVGLYLFANLIYEGRGGRAGA